MNRGLVCRDPASADCPKTPFPALCTSHLTEWEDPHQMRPDHVIDAC